MKPLYGADYGDVESNDDGSPDARGDVRTDARDGGAVLRADDGYVRTVGRADGHGGAIGFRSADGRALDGRRRHPRATASRNPIPFLLLLLIPPPRITPLTIYKSGAFVLAACKALAIFAAHFVQPSGACKQTAGRGSHR